MASQADLEFQITIIQGDIDAVEVQLITAQEQNDTTAVKQLQAQLETLREELAQVQEELNNLNVVGEEDPFEASRLEAEAKLDNTVDPTDATVGEEDPFEASRLEAEAKLDAINPDLADEQTTSNMGGIPGATTRAQSQATTQDTTNFKLKDDWRVRLALAPAATYLYKDNTNVLLAPLRATDGIVFPYVPTINITYAASYNATSPTHSNYKIFQYENSSVDNINITCDFTAQDTEEARYMLAVIHFLRSVTKMFYGQDQNPKPGTPPPLCYLFGMGEFQFNAHPLAVTNFSYNLPNDVDYIRVSDVTTMPGQDKQGVNSSGNKPNTNSLGQLLQNAIQDRLSQGIAKLGSAIGLKLQPGGNLAGPGFGLQRGFNSVTPPGTVDPTYVPTKIQIAITAVPIISRYEISNNFSVKEYANGSLMRGIKRPGGGMW